MTTALAIFVLIVICIPFWILQFVIVPRSTRRKVTETLAKIGVAETELALEAQGEGLAFAAQRDDIEVAGWVQEPMLGGGPLRSLRALRKSHVTFACGRLPPHVTVKRIGFLGRRTGTPTGDARFDERFSVTGDAAEIETLLTQQVRALFVASEMSLTNQSLSFQRSGVVSRATFERAVLSGHMLAQLLTARAVV